MMTITVVVSALRSIAEKHDGVLKAEDVIEAARPVKSPLHSKFTWDDSEAAAKYRLIEARELIRTTIQYIDVSGEQQPFRVFCSLTPDRENDGGGYREVSAVLSNKTFREQLIADALAEMKAFQDRYAKIKALAGVIREIKKVLADRESEPKSKVA